MTVRREGIAVRRVDEALRARYSIATEVTEEERSSFVYVSFVANRLSSFTYCFCLP